MLNEQFPIRIESAENGFVLNFYDRSKTPGSSEVKRVYGSRRELMAALETLLAKQDIKVGE